MQKIQTLADLQAIIDVIPTPVFIKNRAHRIVLLNASACDFFGHSRDELLSKSDYDLFPEAQVRVFHAADERVFSSGRTNENEEEVSDASGNLRHVITRKSKVRLESGTDYLVAVVTDVTAYRKAEARNRYLAFHDQLTGLPNRALLDERLDQALAVDRPDFVLFYVDLDRFKEVNDTYGHPVGDELIRAFAARISRIVRASDTVARIGGDEFAVIVQTGEGATAEDVGGRIVEAAAAPFQLSSTQIFAGASVGVAAISNEPVDRIELQRRADVALYEAKRAGRNCFRLFTPALDATTRSKQLLEAELRTALETGTGLEVHYQPVLSNQDETVVAMEALVRWRHPRLGLLGPQLFVGVAEESGLIEALGDWVMVQACTTMAPWSFASVAVNVSPVQLRKPGFDERVLAILAESELPAARLQLEITETTALEADGQAADILQRLRREGVQIVLDDFGTGYSSLSHLHRLQVDKVKIDSSFVAALGEHESSVIVDAVARLGNRLGICVTAEGVHTDEQRQQLRNSGCTELQGYLFSRPLPSDDATRFLREAARRRDAAAA